MNFKLIFILLYVFISSLVTFILFYVDKQKAKHHRWRIPESTLLSFSFIGGSYGAFLAMKKFRHKTKHPKFYIMVPLMMILHIAILIFAFVKLI